MSKIIIVGAGIDGLMTAFYAHQQGYDVQIVAKGDDPRKIIDVGEYFASTYNGQETRYVTPYEGHSYLGNTPMYPDMQRAFSKSYDQGGWLGKSLDRYSSREQRWLNKRSKVDGNEEFKSNSFDWYVAANLSAMGRWEDMRVNFPELFEGTEVRDDVIRAYDNPDLYEFAKQLHKKDGVLLEAAEGKGVANKYPHFREAYENGLISGILKIKGFSIDAQRFCRNMIDYLESRGVKFEFDTEITQLDRNNEGQVTGLIGESKRFEADSYSLHMGAYDINNILKNTTAEDSIAGMEGRWVKMAAPEGMRHSIKIHGDMVSGKPVIDQNHALAGDKAIIGFGYLFAGFDPDNASPELRKECDEDNIGLIREFFPAHSDLFHIEKVEKGCVRSWTHDDLPRADSLATDKGGVLLICGGGNTGSFTQAPTQAANNLSRLKKEPNASISELLQLHEHSESLTR